MKIPKFLIVSLIAIALLAATAWAEKPESKGPVKILGVVQILDGNDILLEIYGENFTDGFVEPKVTIEEVSIVIMDGWNSEFITAKMPLNDPGDYLLKVTNHKGKSDDFYLTIREGQQDGSEDDTGFLPMVISLVEVDTKLGILTCHGHNFDPATGVDTEVKLDDLLLNTTTVLDVTTHTYNKIEAVLPVDFDSTGNYLLTVKTDEGEENFDAHGLYGSLDEEDSREPLNQLLITNASIQYDDVRSCLTVSGYNFDIGNWPPVVDVGGIVFTLESDGSHSNQIVACYEDSVDPDLTLDPVLVNPQTDDQTWNYDAWIFPFTEDPLPTTNGFENYWKECCADKQVQECNEEHWTDTNRRKGPYPICFQLTEDYDFDLKATFSDETWPYEYQPGIQDPRYFPELGPSYGSDIRYGWQDALYEHVSDFMPPSDRWCEEETTAFDFDIPGQKKYFVLEPEGLLKLKKGYRWDGPTPPGKMKKPPDYKEILMRASLIHDTVYDLMRMKCLERDAKWPPNIPDPPADTHGKGFKNQLTADNSFYAICLRDGAPRVKCGGWWYGIRWGGVYNTHHNISKWKSHALADAGQDYLSECGSSKGVEIALDGTESRHADANSYKWIWEGEVQATGETPIATFHQDIESDGTVKNEKVTPVSLSVDLNPEDPDFPELWSKYSMDTDDVKITVLPDNEDPVITGISEPLAMWPPKHQYVSYTIEDFVHSVSDNCAEISLDDLVISQVTSDEPEDAKADGNTKDDMVIASDGRSVDLRAERQGGGNGRVYTITVTAEDDNGNTGEGFFQVIVPVSIKENVIDDDPVYSVTF